MTECNIQDLATHRFSSGICVRCGRTPLELAAYVTYYLCDHDLQLGGGCNKCGATGPGLSFEDGSIQVIHKWTGRGRPGLALKVVGDVFERESLPTGGELHTRLAEELDRALDSIPQTADVFLVGGMYVRGLLVYALRSAAKITDALKRPDKQPLGPVASSRTVSVGKRKIND